MIKEILAKLNSRKLWITIGAAALVAIATELGLPEESVNHYVNLAMVYVLGQGGVDAAKALKTPKED